MINLGAVGRLPFDAKKRANSQKRLHEGGTGGAGLGIEYQSATGVAIGSNSQAKLEGKEHRLQSQPPDRGLQALFSTHHT